MKQISNLGNLLDKEFQEIIINMLTELVRMNKHGEDFNKKIENVGKYHTKEYHTMELKNTIAQLKNTLKGFNSRLGEAEEQSNEVEDKAWELS